MVIITSQRHLYLLIEEDVCEYTTVMGALFLPVEQISAELLLFHRENISEIQVN